jgi:hypothetical protein
VSVGGQHRSVKFTFGILCEFPCWATPERQVHIRHIVLISVLGNTGSVKFTFGNTGSVKFTFGNIGSGRIP